MKKYLLGLVLVTLGLSSQAAKYANYTGKIKSIYFHDRESPYMGFRLEGKIDSNPCGGPSTDVYLINPENLNDRMFSMLLAAHASKATVTMYYSDLAGNKGCHGVYPSFNMVEVH